MKRSVVGLVGVSGFSGSGKTTAAKHLSKLTGGEYLYLGQTVLNEVRARALPDTPENERRVRMDLRQRGPAVLAIPYIDWVAECIGNGISVFVDAIFVQQEFNVLTSRIPASSALLLAIDTSFDIRSARLACRAERPFNPEELRKRDKTELELGTGTVIKAAKNTIRNEGTLDEFYLALAEFVSSCG